MKVVLAIGKNLTHRKHGTFFAGSEYDVTQEVWEELKKARDESGRCFFRLAGAAPEPQQPKKLKLSKSPSTPAQVEGGEASGGVEV